MSKLPEGRKPLPNEWFIDRANSWGQGKENNMNRDESDAISLVAEMKRQNLTLAEALEAMKNYANDKEFNNNLDKLYGNEVFDDWDYWHEGDID